MSHDVQLSATSAPSKRNLAELTHVIWLSASKACPRHTRCDRISLDQSAFHRAIEFRLPGVVVRNPVVNKNSRHGLNLRVGKTSQNSHSTARALELAIARKERERQLTEKRRRESEENSHKDRQCDNSGRRPFIGSPNLAAVANPFGVSHLARGGVVARFWLFAACFRLFCCVAGEMKNLRPSAAYGCRMPPCLNVIGNVREGFPSWDRSGLGPLAGISACWTRGNHKR